MAAKKTKDQLVTERKSADLHVTLLAKGLQGAMENHYDFEPGDGATLVSWCEDLADAINVRHEAREAYWASGPTRRRRTRVNMKRKVTKDKTKTKV